MLSKNYVINTSKDIEDVTKHFEILKGKIPSDHNESFWRGIGEKSPPSLSDSKLFYGKISNQEFTLTTYISPPIKIQGYFEESENKTSIHLNLKYDTFEAQARGLFLASSYPIILGCLFIVGLQDPTNIWVYIYGLIALTLPIPFSKVYYWWKYAMHDPNPDAFVDNLRQILISGHK